MTPTSPLFSELFNSSEIRIRQRRELAELFGFETRNKYEIRSERDHVIGFCAEQNKGLLGFFLRQTLGHWRSFEIHFFDDHRQLQVVARHPFRWFFQKLEVSTPSGRNLGCIVQRFGVFTKKFDVFNPAGELLFEMRSGLFSFWSFPIKRDNQVIARIAKRWSGILKETFLDADNFRIEFRSELKLEEKVLILVAGMFVDLQYFEKKSR